MTRDFIQIRRFSRVINGGTPTPAEENWGGDVAWATPVDLGQRHGSFLVDTARHLSAAGLAAGSTLVPVGSVLLSTRAPIGYVARAAVPIAFNQGCRAIVPTSSTVDPRFLVYALIHVGPELQSRGQGTTFLELTSSSLASTVIPWASRDYQVSIADFLDRETAQIDELISKQNALIDLLCERRKAVVSQAVTRGLRPNVDLREVGLPWLDIMPAAWALTTLKRLATVQNGITLGRTPDDTSIEVPYLRVANVQSDHVDLGEVKTLAVAAGELGRYLLRAGDVLMTEGGDIDKLGRGCVWDGSIDPCAHQNHIFAVRCSSDLNNRFLTYLLDSRPGRIYFEITAKRATNLASTNSTTLGRFTFGLPDINEQQEIVEYLDRETMRIAELIARARQFVSVLSERRAALITAAVTGKIEVRGAA